MRKLYTKQALAKRQEKLRLAKIELNKLSIQAGKAQEDGGLHENSWAEEARRRAELQAQTVAALENDLNDYEIVPDRSAYGEIPIKVEVGSTITLTRSGKKLTIKIGSYGESDPKAGLMSHNSPLASQIMGMKVGEIKGDIKIISIQNI